MQMQADILGLEVQRPKVTETTALGAACLAGVAVGIWSGAGSGPAPWKLERAFAPIMDDGERCEKRACWLRAVERIRSGS
jgi:glycerol kinase